MYIYKSHPTQYHCFGFSCGNLSTFHVLLLHKLFLFFSHFSKTRQGTNRTLKSGDITENGKKMGIDNPSNT